MCAQVRCVIAHDAKHASCSSTDHGDGKRRAHCGLVNSASNAPSRTAYIGGRLAVPPDNSGPLSPISRRDQALPLGAPCNSGVVNGE